MPKTQKSKSEENPIEQIEYIYRGRNLRVEKGPERTHLFIDDLEVEMEQTEDGVHSHQIMFQTFGTPFELAEELIRQWGEAKPTPVRKPPDQPHH